MSTSKRQIPTLAGVIATLFGVSWKRLLRGRALWVCGLLAVIPSLIAVGLKHDHDMLALMQFAMFRVMAILPPILVASSVGEDIEDKTITYLWSRPIARWTLLLGKVATLAPVAAVVTAAGWAAATAARGLPVQPQELAGFAIGSLAISLIAAGIATIVPRQGMALSLIYLVIIDPTMGEIPASVHDISVTKQVWLLSGLEKGNSPVQAFITLAVIGGIWLAIGFWRIRRLEA